jgi:hypothetical protein
MTTRAQRFWSQTSVERPKSSTRSTLTGRTAKPSSAEEKAHNLGARAGKGARVRTRHRTASRRANQHAAASTISARRTGWSGPSNWPAARPSEGQRRHEPKR